MSQVAEDHDLKKESKAKERLYKNLPVYFTCENCDYTGYTIVEQKTTYISYILMILFVFLFGIFFSIILMPLVILLTRSFFHKCPSCYNEVGSDDKILSIFDLKDKMITFNIGEFGLILSRKIILGIFLTLLLIVTIYTKLDFDGAHFHGPVVPTYESWPSFIDDCGFNVLHHNDQKRIIECERRFLEKTVMNWKGYVIRVEDHRNSFYSFVHHAVVILVKMQPSEIESIPDFSIAVDSHTAAEYNDVIASLNRGGEIAFNATIITLGNKEARHLHLVSIKKESGYIEVPAHIHEFGRFTDKPKYLRSSGNEPEQGQLPDNSQKKDEARDEGQNQNAGQNTNQANNDANNNNNNNQDATPPQQTQPEPTPQDQAVDQAATDSNTDQAQDQTGTPSQEPDQTPGDTADQQTVDTNADANPDASADQQQTQDDVVNDQNPDQAATPSS